MENKYRVKINELNNGEKRYKYLVEQEGKKVNKTRYKEL